MPFSPLISVVGVIFLLSVGLLLALAFEEKFDAKSASEFEQDAAYHTMLVELREMQGRKIRGRVGPSRATDVTPLYERAYAH